MNLSCLGCADAAQDSAANAESSKHSHHFIMKVN